MHRTIGMEHGGTAASLLNQVSLTYPHNQFHEFPIIMHLAGKKEVE